MDIAKYMATALLLSSPFGDMSKTWIIISVIIGIILTLTCGLLLLKEPEKKGK